jgi:hypothetical protein
VSRPWPSGSGTGERGIYAGWVGGIYVHLESGDDGRVRTHLFDPRTQKWSRADFDIVDPSVRERLRQSGARLNFSSFSPQDVTATSDRVILAPNYVQRLSVPAAVLDPVAGQWHVLGASQTPWVGSNSFLRPGEHQLLFWPRPATPHTRAGTAVVLFDPVHLRSTKIPSPPIDIDRESPTVLFDPVHLVVLGGYHKDAAGKVDRVLADGAVYDTGTHRWRVIPDGPLVSTGPGARLYGDHLVLFAGIDPIRARQDPAQPYYKKDIVVKGQAVLDLSSLRWSEPPLDWKDWMIWQPGFAGCATCGPRLSVGERLYLGRRLVYDGDEHRFAVAPEPPVPPSWRSLTERSRERLAGLALDDRHAFLYSQANPEASRHALVLDTQSRQWCSVELPEAAATLLPTATWVTVHDRTLYIWKSARTVTETEPYDCPPGAPCMAPRTIEHHLPAEGVVVSF